MTGKREIFSKTLFLTISIIYICYFSVSAKEPKTFEQRALDYFCTLNLKEKISYYNDIRFNGRTIGKQSRINQIAFCIHGFSMFDSISNAPNTNELDSMVIANRLNAKIFKKEKLSHNCTFLKNHIFAPFNKKIYTLHVFNVVLYKNKQYVELFFINNNEESWVICIGFNENGEPSEHCTSYIIF